MHRPCLLAAVALVVTACGGAATPADVLDSLCTAHAIAGDGDGEAAAGHFETAAHGPLHDLADDLAAVDRTAASQLMVAKFDLESAIRADTMAPAPVVRDRIAIVIDHVQDALATLDRPVDDC